MAYHRELLWRHGARGAPFAVYKVHLEAEPYPENGLSGFVHLGYAPILVLADTGSQPGLIYRYDYEQNRIRIHYFNSAIGEVFELPMGQELTLTVRFFVVYDFMGSSS